MAVNMMGTMVMVMIAILALLLKEGYLVDICLIYAMISFLAVIVLTKVYMGVHSEKRTQRRESGMEVFEWLRFMIGTAVLLCGLAIFVIEIYGIFHLKYVLNRMHAAAMGDTLGISISLIGLMVFPVLILPL